jgi:hypothetical protein
MKHCFSIKPLSKGFANPSKVRGPTAADRAIISPAPYLKIKSE